ncbi:type IV pilus assembly protein PilO [Desulfosarcina sp. BuS5]|uniref:type 4a pilus biogenesis protein PilO n=1 Tax=Desulfosarcina sp. BuS5 TaxID=933262 RepID=UPI000557FEE1|nr:type 4a pilus biogenesis protein PilO [Desulfosarcina sp. BuS5]WDN88111.1 type IV pilus assembly protein PilO [Desulfosarcina sp. BuS5]
MEKVKQSIKEFFGKIEKLTKVQRLSICIITLFVIIGGFSYFSYWPKSKRIKAYRSECKQLEAKLVKAKKNAADIDSFREKIARKKVQFKIVMQALPEQKEIPSLISSISRSGLDAGLEFLLFKPQAEKSQGFYAEIPVSIKVTGTYHNVAVFFDKVSRLSRIVNIENIKMSSGKSSRQSAITLNTSCKAVTYRFIDTKGKKKPKKKK